MIGSPLHTVSMVGTLKPKEQKPIVLEKWTSSLLKAFCFMEEIRCSVIMKNDFQHIIA